MAVRNNSTGDQEFSDDSDDILSCDSSSLSSLVPLFCPAAASEEELTRARRLLHLQSHLVYAPLELPQPFSTKWKMFLEEKMNPTSILEEAKDLFLKKKRRTATENEFPECHVNHSEVKTRIALIRSSLRNSIMFHKQDMGMKGKHMKRRILFVRQLVVKAIVDDMTVTDTLNNAYDSMGLDWEVEEVESPLIIIGLPRTGTTFLLELLSSDAERWRTLKNFEAHWFTKPLSDSQNAIEEQRIHVAMGELYNEMTGQSHYETIWGPTEDATAMLKGLCGCYMRLPMYIGPEQDFRKKENLSSLDGVGPQTGKFDKSFLQDDSRQLTDFNFYKNQLKLLQAASRLRAKKSGAQKGLCGRRWCLKDPIHLVHLRTLLHTFKNARVVFLHRHPSHSVASGAALVEAVNACVNLKLDEKKQRRSWAQFLMTTYGGLANSAVWFRSQIDQSDETNDFTNGAKFLDIYYDDLINDPISIAEKIYTFADEKFCEGVRLEMETFLSISYESRLTGVRKPKKFTTDDFGIDVEEINRSFKPYLNRYFSGSATPSRGSQPPESSN